MSRASEPARGTRSLALAGLFACLLTPLVVLPDSVFLFVVPKAVFFRLMVTVPLVIWAVHFFRRRVRMVGTDPLLVALGLFLFAGLLSALAGVSLSRSLFGDLQRMFGLLTWFYLAGFYLCIRTFAAGERDWRWLLRIVVAVGMAVLSLHLLGYRVIGNVGLLGIYFFLVAAVALLSAVRSERWGERMVMWSAAALLLAGVVGLGERGPVLASGVLIVAVAIGGLLGRRAWSSRTAILTLFLGVAAGVLGALSNPAALSRLTSTSFLEASFQARLMFWGAALQAFRERPLLGTGIENVIVAISRHFPVRLYEITPSETIIDRSHSAWFDVLATMGVVGLTAYAAIWTAILFEAVHGWRSGRISALEASVYTGATLGYMLFLSFWFEDQTALPLLLLLAASLLVRSRGPLVEWSEQPDRSGSRLLVALVAAAVLAFVGHRHGVRVLHAARLALPEASADGTVPVESSLSAFESAHAVGAPEAVDIITLHVRYLRGFGPQAAEIRRSPGAAARFDRSVRSALGAMDQALEREPQNDVLWIDRAGLLTFATVLYEEEAVYEAAIRSAERAIELAPDRLRHYHVLAGILLLDGRASRADSVLDAALVRSDRFGETFDFKARVALARDDPRAAQAWIRGAWERGHTGDDHVLLGLAALAERAGDFQALAALYRDRIHLPRGYARARTDYPFVAPVGPDTLMARLPLLWLAAGDPRQAVTVARELAAEDHRAEGLVDRFEEDVLRGRSQPWLRYRTLYDARRMLGGRTLADPGVPRR
jgi:O-antigen ligase/tetratricopeptide (TPR) repeat protein